MKQAFVIGEMLTKYNCRYSLGYTWREHATRCDALKKRLTKVAECCCCCWRQLTVVWAAITIHIIVSHQLLTMSADIQ